MATLNFITSNSNGNYIVSDISDGLTNPPYTSKEVQIASTSGSYVYDSGPVPITQNVFTVPVTSQWTTTLAIVQIVVTFSYFKGLESDVVTHTYYLPTLLNQQLG
jgi:hypothetical protein